MSLPQITRSSMVRLAERRILEAIELGEFEDLPGLGRPIPDLDDPYDPDWWVKSWMKRHQAHERKDAEASLQRVRGLLAPASNPFRSRSEPPPSSGEVKRAG
jgi:hypothetical protein